MINTRIGQYRTTRHWSPDLLPNHLTVPMVTTFDGLQQTANFGVYVVLDREVNKNWKVLISQSKDASNPYLRTGFNYIIPCTFNGSDRNAVNMYSDVRLRGTSGTSIYVPGSNDALRDQALARFKRKLNDAVGSYQAAVPLVELRELRGTILKAAQYTRDFFLRRGGSLLGTHDIRTSSNLWLTYAFGVNPMVNDAIAASNAIRDYLARDAPKLRITGTASETTFDSRTSTSTGTRHQNVTFVRQSSAVLSYQYVGGVDLSFLTGNDYSVLEHFGLAPENLPSLGWELFPYSWILDYFTTAGDFFEDTFVLPEGALTYLNLCTKIVSDTILTARFAGAPTVQVLEESCVPGGWQYWSFQRTKLTSVPRRSFRFKTSDEIGKGFVNKLLNLVSLLGSRVGLRRR